MLFIDIKHSPSWNRLWKEFHTEVCRHLYFGGKRPSRRIYMEKIGMIGYVKFASKSNTAISMTPSFSKNGEVLRGVCLHNDQAQV